MYTGLTNLGLNSSSSSYTPASLFTHSEQGAWYDPSDLNSMYQESTGITPAVVGQPVGLILDKRLGLVRGAELRTAFTAGDAGALVTDDGTTVRVTNNDATAAFTAANQAVVVGQWYELTYTLLAKPASSNARVLFAGYDSGSALTPGTYRRIVQASTTSGLTLANGTSTVLSEYSEWNGVSVKALAGNHATQATSASRPVLSARYNQLLKTEDIADAAWTKAGGAVTAGVFIPDTNNTLHRVHQGFVGTLNIAYKVRGRVKPEGVRYININTDATLGVRWTLDTQNGATVAAGVNSAGANIVATLAADGYWDFSYTGIGTGTTGNFVWFQSSSTFTAADSTYISDGIVGFRATQVDVRTAADAALNIPAYQRVNTTTDYDTVGFPHYLSFDGFDDGMATASVDFTATDKVTVWAGVHKASDAATGALLELSADPNVNNGCFGVYAPILSVSSFTGRSKGAVMVDVTAPIASFPAPTSAVVTVQGDISGDVSRIRVNSAYTNLNGGDQGAGNYGNYPIYIGRRASSSLPFNGRIYGLIVRGTASSANEIAQIERYVGAKTGVVL